MSVEIDEAKKYIKYIEGLINELQNLESDAFKLKNLLEFSYNQVSDEYLIDLIKKDFGAGGLRFILNKLSSSSLGKIDESVIAKKMQILNAIKLIKTT